MQNSNDYNVEEVQNLINIFNSRMRKIKDIYKSGDILNDNGYIEETEQIIQKIEKITGRYSLG